MATTFNVFYLGTAADLDPIEGGGNHTENAGAIVGTTFGSVGDPLAGHVQTFAPGTGGFSGGDSIAYDGDNSLYNEKFTIDGGADQTIDSSAIYNATITYIDGTTATISAVVLQDTAGHLYLAPEISYNADQAALEAQPIRSLTLDSVNSHNGVLSADRVVGTYSDGIVDGTTGNDSIGVGHIDGDGDQITSGNDIVHGGAGNDTIDAGSGNDVIDGGTGDDVIYGDPGSDTLYGGDDSDIFSITDNHGTDILFGGEGGFDFDAIAFSNYLSSQGVSVTFSGDGAGSYDFLGTAGSGSFSEIEALWTTNYADYIDGSADTTGFRVGSYGGNDTIIGGSGNDLLWGGDGDDMITGGDGADMLWGEGGNDSLSGGAGNDMIWGGTGADVMTGDDGDDLFAQEAGFGNDTIYGHTGNDTIDASAVGGDLTVWFSTADSGTMTDGFGTATFNTVETFVLGGGQDYFYAGLNTGGVTVYGIDNIDDITGGSGGDTLDGGDGNDDLTGLGGDDSLIGGAGLDYLAGDGGNDTLDGGADDDILDGGSGNDLLDGGSGDDELDGGSGDDTLIGGDGTDTLDGGIGDDLLTGGAGDDTVLYAPGDGNDTITDFNTGNTGTLSDGISTNNDAIDLSGFYDDIWELYADQADDGVLNQSNDGVGGVDYSDNAQFGTGSLTFTGASADSSFFTVENTGVVCFTSGTAIRTPRGDVLIDELRVGDLVSTMDNGPQPIRWIGRRDLDHATLIAAPKLRPVLIRRGLLGVQRDLLVSPQHGVLIGPDHLVRAKYLADAPGSKIRIAQGKRNVTYIHLMFDAHQIIWAENLPSESFYPGPMAQKAITAEPLKELHALFPTVVSSQVSLRKIKTEYGETARLFIARKSVRTVLQLPRTG